MNRGDMRDHVFDVMEADADKPHTRRQVDRALNRAAESVHGKISRMGGVQYARKQVQFTATGAQEYLLEGVTDFKRPRILKRTVTTDSTGVIGLGRGFFGPREDIARIIPENQKSNVEYQCGYDREGRPVAYMRSNADRANHKIQLTNISGTPTSGNWTITIKSVTSANIAYNANAATIQAALEAMSSVGTGNVTVTGDLPGTTTIEFVESLALTAMGDITVADTFDTGDLQVTVVTTGLAQWSVFFIAGETGQWTLEYDRHVRQVTPYIGSNGDGTGTATATDTANDLLSYETIPDEWHKVVHYEAAIDLLGIHNDARDPIVQTLVRYHQDMDDALMQGTSRGTVQQIGSAWPQ